MEYNPIFSKTAQGGSQKCAESKWLVQNKKQPEFCPVRLYESLIDKRPPNATTDRFFLTPNPKFLLNNIWYKTVPIGRNTISSWTRDSAERTGLDTQIKKITNHSNRSTTVSQLAKSGVQEQQLIKITGHGNVNSIKPYLQLDEDHHVSLIQGLRKNTTSLSTESEGCNTGIGSTSDMEIQRPSEFSEFHQPQTTAMTSKFINQNHNTPVTYQNCTFYSNCSFQKQD